MSSQHKVTDHFKTEHLQADLRRRSVRGGLATLTSQGAQFLIQTISIIVLGRLLTPAHFGMVAMVTAVTGLAGTFADLGLSEATIQRKQISPKQISTLFWVNVAIGAGLMLFTAILAPVLTWFYGEPRLRAITLVTSLMFLIGGLRVQHDALLKRQMRFLSIAVRDVTSAALAVSVAIIMAVQGASYWAIVAMPLVGQFTQMALSWWLVRWWPGLPRRDAGIRSMLVFGGNVAASYAIHYVTHNADKVLIGRFSGATPLGLYSRAYNLLMLPVRQFMSPVTAVAVPAFSRLQDDEERFARYYLRIVSVMMWVCAPLFAFLGVAAEPVIVLAVGNQWRESVPVFQILAVSGLAELLLSSSTHWLLVSRGQSAKFLKLGLITAPLILGSFAMGLPFGIKGVALSYSSVVVVILPWALHFAFDGTHITLQRLGRVLMYPAMVSVLGVLSAKIAVYFTEPVGMLSKLLVIALGFAGAFLLSALIPRVREEVVSFRGLLSDLRRSNLPPRPGLVS